MIDSTEAFVRLLGEELEVWRPCQVYLVCESLAILLSDEYSPEDKTECWECFPGDVVAIERKKDRLYISPTQLNR